MRCTNFSFLSFFLFSSPVVSSLVFSSFLFLYLLFLLFFFSFLFFFFHFLPTLCLGGESGKVHSSVRALWNEKDPGIVSGMKSLGGLTDSAVECLKKQDIPGLAVLMEENFALRRRMYGDDVVGQLNIQMADLASTFGLAAKFTGSGGALICLQRNGQGWCVRTKDSEICFISFHEDCFDLPTTLDWEFRLSESFSQSFILSFQYFSFIHLFIYLFI